MSKSQITKMIASRFFQAGKFSRLLGIKKGPQMLVRSHACRTHHEVSRTHLNYRLLETLFSPLDVAIQS